MMAGLLWTYGEGALANDDEGTVEDVNLLSGSLQGLRLCREGADVGNRLSWSDCSKSWDGKGSKGGSGEGAEGNHF